MKRVISASSTIHETGLYCISLINYMKLVTINLTKKRNCMETTGKLVNTSIPNHMKLVNTVHICLINYMKRVNISLTNKMKLVIISLIDNMKLVNNSLINNLKLVNNSLINFM
jgi:hypothetical protein